MVSGGSVKAIFTDCDCARVKNVNRQSKTAIAVAWIWFFILFGFLGVTKLH